MEYPAAKKMNQTIYDIDDDHKQKTEQKTPDPKDIWYHLFKFKPGNTVVFRDVFLCFLRKEKNSYLLIMIILLLVSNIYLWFLSTVTWVFAVIVYKLLRKYLQASSDFDLSISFFILYTIILWYTYCTTVLLPSTHQWPEEKRGVSPMKALNPIPIFCPWSTKSQAVSSCGGAPFLVHHCPPGARLRAGLAPGRWVTLVLPWWRGFILSSPSEPPDTEGFTLALGKRGGERPSHGTQDLLKTPGRPPSSLHFSNMLPQFPMESKLLKEQPWIVHC